MARAPNIPAVFSATATGAGAGAGALLLRSSRPRPCPCRRLPRARLLTETNPSLSIAGLRPSPPSRRPTPCPCPRPRPRRRGLRPLAGGRDATPRTPVVLVCAFIVGFAVVLIRYGVVLLTRITLNLRYTGNPHAPRRRPVVRLAHTPCCLDTHLDHVVLVHHTILQSRLRSKRLKTRTSESTTRWGARLWG